MRIQTRQRVRLARASSAAEETVGGRSGTGVDGRGDSLGVTRRSIRGRAYCARETARLQAGTDLLRLLSLGQDGRFDGHELDAGLGVRLNGEEQVAHNRNGLSTDLSVIRVENLNDSIAGKKDGFPSNFAGYQSFGPARNHSAVGHHGASND